MKILKKNIQPGKIKVKLIFLLFFFFLSNGHSNENSNYEGNFVEIKILDKLSSKNTSLNLQIGKEEKYKNLSVKAALKTFDHPVYDIWLVKCYS